MNRIEVFKMGTSPKSHTSFFLFFFFFIFFGCTGIELVPPIVEAQSLNHRTAREVPVVNAHFFFFFLLCHVVCEIVVS